MRIPFIFDDFHFCCSRVIGLDMTENRIFTLCRMITWVVFLRISISSYSFGATALIFCRMFIHIMEVCMSTGFWWSGGVIICVLQTHFIFKISPNKTTLSIIIKCGAYFFSSLKIWTFCMNVQHSLKLGGINYHFKWVKVPGTAPYWKAWGICHLTFSFSWSTLC